MVSKSPSNQFGELRAGFHPMKFWLGQIKIPHLNHIHLGKIPRKIRTNCAFHNPKLTPAVSLKKLGRTKPKISSSWDFTNSKKKRPNYPSRIEWVPIIGNSHEPHRVYATILRILLLKVGWPYKSTVYIYINASKIEWDRIPTDPVQEVAIELLYTQFFSGSVDRGSCWRLLGN